MLNRAVRFIALLVFIFAAVLRSEPAAAQVEPYVGQIMCGGWNFVPRGWMRMDGQLLLIAQYSALFSLLGTTYGGNGRTTFALPDLRGRVPMHWGQGPGLSNRNLGEHAGSETNTLTVEQLPEHTHVVAPLGSDNDANSTSPAGKVPATKSRTTLYTDPANLNTQAATTTTATGSHAPINNMPPYLTFTCVIAVQGVYPSRE